MLTICVLIMWPWVLEAAMQLVRNGVPTAALGMTDWRRASGSPQLCYVGSISNGQFGFRGPTRTVNNGGPFYCKMYQNVSITCNRNTTLTVTSALFKDPPDFALVVVSALDAKGNNLSHKTLANVYGGNLVTSTANLTVDPCIRALRIEFSSYIDAATTNNLHLNADAGASDISVLLPAASACTVWSGSMLTSISSDQAGCESSTSSTSPSLSCTRVNRLTSTTPSWTLSGASAIQTTASTGFLSATATPSFLLSAAVSSSSTTSIKRTSSLTRVRTLSQSIEFSNSVSQTMLTSHRTVSSSVRRTSSSNSITPTHHNNRTSSNSVTESGMKSASVTDLQTQTDTIAVPPASPTFVQPTGVQASETVAVVFASIAATAAASSVLSQVVLGVGQCTEYHSRDTSDDPPAMHLVSPFWATNSCKMVALGNPLLAGVTLGLHLLACRCYALVLGCAASACRARLRWPHWSLVFATLMVQGTLLGAVRCLGYDADGSDIVVGLLGLLLGAVLGLNFFVVRWRYAANVWLEPREVVQAGVGFHFFCQLRTGCRYRQTKSTVRLFRRCAVSLCSGGLQCRSLQCRSCTPS